MMRSQLRYNLSMLSNRMFVGAAAWVLAALMPVWAQSGVNDPVVEAREALRKKDGAALLALRDRTAAQGHPLAQWVDYWELSNRIDQAQQSELDAFYVRWPASYVEDRLRNDWLLELGKRRDWANLAREFPRFRMNDDREVTCYALLNEHQTMAEAGKPLPASFKSRALDAWFAQREADEGCQLMATTLVEAKVRAWRSSRTGCAWRGMRRVWPPPRPRPKSARHLTTPPAIW
jgi:soluble lytic murein transglycosylase